MQPNLTVVVLALEAQGLQSWGVLRPGSTPGDFDSIPVPPDLVDGFSVAIGQFLGAEVIVGVVVLHQFSQLLIGRRDVNG